MNSKQLEQLKKEIIEEGALQVGFYPSVISELVASSYELISAFIKTMSEQGKNLEGMSDAELLSAFVTKGIEKIELETFERLVPYFFNVSERQGELVAKALETSQEKNMEEAVTMNDTLSVVVEWNERSSDESLHFLCGAHENEVITRELLEMMIQDEIYLEKSKSLGYYKVQTTLDRLDIGDGFEANEFLYQSLADANHLNFDVKAYYQEHSPQQAVDLSPKAMLEEVLERLELPEQFKVKSIRLNDYAIMKESLGGLLNEPVVYWDEGEAHYKIKDKACQLTGHPLFETEFSQAVSEVLKEKEEETCFFERPSIIKDEFSNEIEL
ncbi:hypothetical protein [Lactococcus lactis]